MPTPPLSASQLEGMVVEFHGAHGRVRLSGAAAIEDPTEPDVLRIDAPRSIEVVQEREYVRIKSARPVLVYGGPDLIQIESYTVDISGGGFLLAGPDALKVGDEVEFQLELNPGEPPVVRDGQGRADRPPRAPRRSPSSRSATSTGAGSCASSSSASAPNCASRPGNGRAPWQLTPQPRRLQAAEQAARPRRWRRRPSRGRPRRDRTAPDAKAKGEGKAKPDKKAKPPRRGQEGRQGRAGARRDGDGPSVAAHPRAARGVARAKGWGGLAGFVLGGYLSLPTNTLAAAGLRALLAGVVCYVAAWAGAVFLWRRLVMLEIKGASSSCAAARVRPELPPAPAERPTAPAGSRARAAA